MKLVEDGIDAAGIERSMIVAVGSDHEASICLALRNSEWAHFGCAMHRLGLTMKKFAKIPGEERRIRT